MNYLQFGLFGVYVFSAFFLGAFIYKIINKGDVSFINRWIYLGECLLIGSILIYAEMMILSLLGLYSAPYLWGAVLLNYSVLFSGTMKGVFEKYLLRGVRWDIPVLIFFALVLFFIFRNSFFLVDIDSHKTYLFTQKIWLEHGTSLVGDIATDVTVFAPQFDAIPYGLGLSIFNNETLFPELINLFWRLIALVLVFGYTSFRFNRTYGLAAGMLVLFNDHFFYSGANNCCVINSALIALLFAAGYNLWESRSQKNPFRFLLALVFLSQLMSNKFQMAYIVIMMAILGILIQERPIQRLKQIVGDKKLFFVIIAAAMITSLYFIKNYLITGFPIFPIYAGKFGIFGWTPEKGDTFIKILGGLKITLFLKYMNYFFIWHGINASKYVILVISFLPFILMILILRHKIEKNSILEFCYWLGLSILLIMGIALASYVDPRYYRYAIAVLSFTAIFSIDFIFRQCLGLKYKWILIGIILILSMRGYKIMFIQAGAYLRPTFEDNINVLLNRMHTADIIERYYPGNIIIAKALQDKRVQEKLKKSAWGYGQGDPHYISPFFSPTRPQVSFWLTTVVNWDSYKSKKLIIQDLKNYGLEWIIRVEKGKFVFLSLEEYAREAVNYVRRPKTMMYNYNFPKELAEVKY